MDVSQALRERRSVRAFTSQVPSAELVQQLMQDAALAASGGNMQPWRVAALTGDALQAMLADVAKTPGEENPAYLSYPPTCGSPTAPAALRMAKTCTPALVCRARTRPGACSSWPRMHSSLVRRSG
ncbi:5,6-dimethylbenzimidazole synthase [Comamonas aquatica]|nr:5,6-dimethylbenzimidazole synthase [Comamonas aquatica]CAC9229786.1 5,6-dimethylbenzimidazole synthase [Comamonas aquatica]